MKILHVDDEEKKCLRIRIDLGPSGIGEFLDIELEQVGNFQEFKDKFVTNKPNAVISDGFFPLNENEGSLADGWLLVIGFLKEQGFTGKLIIDSPSQIDVSPYQNLPFTVTRHNQDNSITMQLLEYNCKLDPEFAKTRIDQGRLSQLKETLQNISALTSRHELTTQIDDNDIFWLADNDLISFLDQQDGNVFFIDKCELTSLAQIYVILTKAKVKLRLGELKDSVIRLSDELAEYIPTKAIERLKSIQSQRQIKILYVEDDLLLGPSGKELLESFGYEVCLAASLDEAKLQFTVFRPDVVFTDNDLPQKNAGLKLIDFIKESTRPETKIIWYSGSLTTTPEMAKQAGADHAFSKPIDFVEEIIPILEEISAELSRKKG